MPVEALDRQVESQVLEATEPSDASVEARRGRQFRDLLIISSLLVLGLISTQAPLLIRIPIGIAAVMLVPGYALVAALFPTRTQIDFIERIALALATSIGLIVVQALLLDWLPGGLTAESIRVTVGLTSSVLLAIGFVRRQRAHPAVARVTNPDVRPRRSASRAIRFTQAIVVANIAVAALAYGLTIGAGHPAPTEFWIVPVEGQAYGYPADVEVGSSVEFYLGLRQQSDAPGRYSIVVRRDDDVLQTLGPIAVQAGEQWGGDLRIVADRIGADQALTIELMRDDATSPVRTLRLWLNVTAEGDR